MIALPTFRPIDTPQTALDELLDDDELELLGLELELGELLLDPLELAELEELLDEWLLELEDDDGDELLDELDEWLLELDVDELDDGDELEELLDELGLLLDELELLGLDDELLEELDDEHGDIEQGIGVTTILGDQPDGGVELLEELNPEELPE